MFNRRLRSTFSLLLKSSALAGLLCIAGASNAQAEPPCCVNDPECLSLVNQARLCSELQQFEAALHLYEQAYAHVTDPGLLPNIGRMQQRLGWDDQALTTYRLFLSQPPLPNDEEYRRTVPEWIVETQQHKQSLESPTLPKPQTAPMLVLQTDKAVDTHSQNNSSKHVKLVRSPWLWGGVSAAIAVTAAVAIGLRVGLSRPSCPDSVLCFNFKGASK